MLLSQLLDGFCSLGPGVEADIRHLSSDSRLVSDGSVFVALPGKQVDGKRFITEAIANGACAVFTEETSDQLAHTYPVPIIRIQRLTEQLALIAAKFYGYPAQKMKLIGVTGTNGKTSTAHYIAQLFHYQGIACGLMGSLGRGFYGQLTESVLNTPDAISLQQTLAEFVSAGVKVAVMEVSSHGIAQHRIAGVPFALGIFTNLTQDHLDYHQTMDNYAQVKYQFLASPLVEQVIINADDDYGAKWCSSLKENKATLSYGLRSDVQQANIYPQSWQANFTGLQADLVTPWGKGNLHASLLGEFNLYNLLSAVAAGNLMGLSLSQILAVIPQLQSVPGRMQVIRQPHKPLVIVDHSHTPDALEKALTALKSVITGKLYCVFGCGGDRDKSKRGQMARIAERYADKVIVTSDNPRSENPHDIIADVLTGFIDKQAVLVEVDRSKAIQKSIQLAKEKDCILIAGKGAERYQLIGKDKIPFNDADKATQFLQD